MWKFTRPQQNPENPEIHRAECIGFVNHKGGTGKTTSCLSIAGFLAKGKKKVLVVDFDPQANATSGLGIDLMTLKYSMYDVILGECEGYEGIPITQVILETDVENLHLAPSELDLGVSEVIMQRSPKRVKMLSHTLDIVRSLYDYILIDLPPSSGLMTINGLYASDQIVIPLDSSIYSIEALENLRLSIRDVKKIAGHPINQITVVLIRYEKPSGFLHKQNPSLEIKTRLIEMFQVVFVVPNSVEIYNSQREGIPISHYAPRCKAGKAYAKIANYLNNHIMEKTDFNDFKT